MSKAKNTVIASKHFIDNDSGNGKEKAEQWLENKLSKLPKNCSGKVSGSKGIFKAKIVK